MVSILVNSLAGGGAERVVLTLAKAFHHSREEVELICLEKERFYSPPEGIKVTYLTNFEAIQNSVVKLIFVVITAFRLKRHVKKNQIKFVHSHLIRSNYINVLARIFGSPHKPLIVNHMMVSFDKKRGFLGKVTMMLYKMLYTRAEAIISISEVMKRDLDDALSLKNREKHQVIPNPHEVEAISSKSKITLEGDVFNPEKRYIISVGRLVQRKRVDILLKAFAKLSKDLPDVEVLVLGDGAQEQVYRQAAKDLGVESKVHFLGHVENPYAYLSRATVYVLSSEDEGLPNIIIEAMACGIPVISSDCKSGPREILSPDSDFSKVLSHELEYAQFGVLFPVGDDLLLAEALVTVLADPAMREAYIENGKLRAQDYRSEKIAREYLAVLT